MNCPICGGKTKVLNSRQRREGIKRKRECLSCFSQFTSYETIVFQEMDKYLLKALLKKQEELN